jgi:hypothetical protein
MAALGWLIITRIDESEDVRERESGGAVEAPPL